MVKFGGLVNSFLFRGYQIMMNGSSSRKYQNIDPKVSRTYSAESCRVERLFSAVHLNFCSGQGFVILTYLACSRPFALRSETEWSTCKNCTLRKRTWKERARVRVSRLCFKRPLRLAFAQETGWSHFRGCANLQRCIFMDIRVEYPILNRITSFTTLFNQHKTHVTSQPQTAALDRAGRRCWLPCHTCSMIGWLWWMNFITRWKLSSEQQLAHLASFNRSCLEVALRSLH